MNYSSFCTTLITFLQSRLEPDITLTRQTILKNNGVRLDAIILASARKSFGPVIYLEPLYENYKTGASVEAICRAVLSSLDHCPPFSPDACFQMQELESMKERIAFRIISRKNNEELLKDVPWIPFLDLAVVFFLHLASTDDGRITALIHNRLSRLWGVSADRLFSYARLNTPSLNPAAITRIEELLSAPASVLPPKDLPSLPSFYVLSGRNCLYGASCMLYDGVLKNFAERMAADLIILPSSIHEVLLIPDRHLLDYDSLCSMVRDINAGEVPREDVLSDHIYLYTRCGSSLKSWPASSSYHMP